jgi:N-acetyl-gamma-glutamyl-phosphate reductase
MSAAMGARVVVLGASGYSGAELLRILCRHPGMEVVAAGARELAGRTVADALPHLANADLMLVSQEDAAAMPADVCFSCLPPGVLDGLGARAGAETVIDLSDDHRADPSWAYGLTEHNRDAVRDSSLIANPGCYPTAALLVLIPFARRGLIDGPVVIDAMSGVSGAGRSSEQRLMAAEMGGNVGAYGTTEHRHIPEMERGLERFGGLDAGVSFTPHLVPIPRGLVVTARAPLSSRATDEDLLQVLEDAYRDEPFVDVVASWPQTKHVHGSNRAVVSARADAACNLLVCSAAIDNLGKGAAGQAVQNANLTLGLDESAGLDATGIWP